jgi:CRISPR system Cascade subunit CasB
MTSTPIVANRLERQMKFLKNLHQRIKNDNATQANLKRALTGDDRHLRNVYSVILPYLPNMSKWQQDLWIFVASLSVYYEQPLDRDLQKNFGFSCRGLATENISKGTDRRFRALLDTASEDLRSPLTALVRQIKTKGIRLDYPQLLFDLGQWDHPDQYIQDQWARTFWGASPPKPDSQDAADFDTNPN